MIKLEYNVITTNFIEYPYPRLERTKQWSLVRSSKCHKDGRYQIMHQRPLFDTIYRSNNCIPDFASLTRIARSTKPKTTNLKHLYKIKLCCHIKLIYMLTIALLLYLLTHAAYALLIIRYFVILWLVLLTMFLQIMIFTACERKMLALIQRRTGPAVVGVRGRLQCLADSLKLLTKVFISARRINSTTFQIAAFGGFWISWYNLGNVTYGPGLDIIEVEYNVFFLFSISLLFSIMWLLAGWSATSKYSMLGCFRAAVQFISFELLMGTIFLVIFILFGCFNFELIVQYQQNAPLVLCFPTLAIIMLFAFFMETNRPPFDLSEAESDVVAGYNVEYSGILFGLFYLGEYLNLFAACTVLVLTFCGGWLKPYYVIHDLIILFYTVLIGTI